jgi:excisionase family DNA binding protein
MEGGLKMEGKVLTLKEASELLKVSPTTIYRLTSGRKIPSLKIGGQIRFRLDSLEAWLKRQERPEIS